MDLAISDMCIRVTESSSSLLASGLVFYPKGYHYWFLFICVAVSDALYQNMESNFFTKYNNMWIKRLTSPRYQVKQPKKVVINNQVKKLVNHHGLCLEGR